MDKYKTATIMPLPKLPVLSLVSFAPAAPPLRASMNRFYEFRVYQE